MLTNIKKFSVLIAIGLLGLGMLFGAAHAATILTVPQGGTGANLFPGGDIIYGNSSDGRFPLQSSENLNFNSSRINFSTGDLDETGNGIGFFVANSSQNIFGEGYLTQNIGAPVFSGSGLNDMSQSGDYTGPSSGDTFTITVTNMGLPGDGFDWSDTLGNLGSGTMDVLPQSLANGISVQWAAATGHTTGDSWMFTDGYNNGYLFNFDGSRGRSEIGDAGSIPVGNATILKVDDPLKDVRVTQGGSTFLDVNTNNGEYLLGDSNDTLHGTWIEADDQDKLINNYVDGVYSIFTAGANNPVFSADTTDWSANIGDISSAQNSTLISVDDPSEIISNRTAKAFRVTDTNGHEWLDVNTTAAHVSKMGDVSSSANGTLFSVDDGNKSITANIATAATAKLDITAGPVSLFRVQGNGVISVQGSAGSSGQVLTSQGSGTPPSWSTLPTSPTIVGTGDVTAQTTANSSIATFTTGGSTSTYRVGGYLNITAVSLDVIQLQCTYTDENGNAQTIILATGSTVVDVAVQDQQIRAKNGTAITIKTVLTTGTGSITYDAGGTIEKVR